MQSKINIQIYEVQDPAEAEAMLDLGVDHIGSVVLSADDWRAPSLRDTVRTVQAAGAVSCLIPLYNQADLVFRTIDYYRPDILHFCEDLSEAAAGPSALQPLVELQASIRERFPDLRIMRSIPIPTGDDTNGFPTLDASRILEPVSDLFLTDTLLASGAVSMPEDQPVTGFVGITGITCNWKTAATLVEESSIPVILAGGISPDNAYDGVVQVRPAGVDSCTRTNAIDSDGRPVRFRKDREKVRKMVAEVRRAERALLSC